MYAPAIYFLVKIRKLKNEELQVSFRRLYSPHVRTVSQFYFNFFISYTSINNSIAFLILLALETRFLRAVREKYVRRAKGTVLP